MRRNRLWNVGNPYQGLYKKVLCVCSAGLLRSPTIAYVLSQEPFNYNTRAVGIHDYALIPLDDVHLHWADEIVCVESEHGAMVKSRLGDRKIPVINLAIPDEYEYRNPTLIRLIKERYTDISKLEIPNGDN